MPVGTRRQTIGGSKKSTKGASGVHKSKPRRSTRRTAARSGNIESPCSPKAIKLEAPPTPRSTPPPHPRTASVPGTTTTSSNVRSDKLNSSYTGSVPRPSQEAPACQQTSANIGDERQPTVNWDCVSYVVSDQKVHTSYEKPEMGPCQVDSNGDPIPSTSKVQAYGKMVTKTVTMTVTTTIATTEILRPGEEGYEASLERQKRQREQGPEEQQKQHRQYRESRKWASGDRSMHENFHYKHHRAAQPAPSTL